MSLRRINDGAKYRRMTKLAPELLGEPRPKVTRFQTRLARLALVVMAPLIIAGCGVNTIPTKEEAAKAKWAEVQNQYQRRSDLIPNLVATVKGYAAQEQRTLVEVTEARASATQVKVDASTITNPAQFQAYQQAQDKLSGVLGRLMLIQEKYPELKSNENFMALQSQLEGTENRIAISRRDYNDSVQDFNTTLRTFPQVIYAHSIYSSSKPMQLFTATAQAQSAPTVSFDNSAPPPPGGAAAAAPPGAAPGSPPPTK
jgi:LemA protein